MSTATEILRVRAAVRRRVSNDPDTLAMADEIEALVELLEAIDEPDGCDGYENGLWIADVKRKADALEAAITSES